MKRAFLLFAVAILLCNITQAQEPDPDPNLLWVSDPSWENGFHRFLVHPNGNILAGIGSTEFELDGNTGLIIRKFPYPAVFYDISPDGKYISALTDQRCVIDYETEEVVATFYTMYFKKPMGKYHIQVCTNVSCMLLKGKELYAHTSEKLGIKHMERTEDGVFSLEEVECMGACGGAPMIAVNEDFYEYMTAEKIDGILDNLRNSG